MHKEIDEKNFIEAVNNYKKYNNNDSIACELGIDIINFVEPLHYFVDEYFSTYFTDEEIDKIYEMIDEDLDAELILKTIIKGRK